MGKMHFSCVSVSPLLMSYNWSPGTRVRPPGYQAPPAREEAEQKLCRHNGVICLPSDWIFAAIHSAYRDGFYPGYKPFSCRRTREFEECGIEIEGQFIPLTNHNAEPNPPWEVDMRRGVSDKKIAIALVHPRFNEWAFAGTMRMAEKCSPKAIYEFLAGAGRAVGLGSFTPHAGRGPYGRFKVKEWRKE
jgi:hypothetical protein